MSVIQTCVCRITTNVYHIDKLTGDKRLRLEYKQWDKLITMKHGIIVEGWPLENFHKPSDCKNRAELQKLLNAVNSGDCRLRKLSATEWVAWKNMNTPWNTVDPARTGERRGQQVLALPSNSQGSMDAEQRTCTPHVLRALAPEPSAAAAAPMVTT